MVSQAREVFQQIAASGSAELRTAIEAELQRHDQFDGFAGLHFSEAASQLGILGCPELRVFRISLVEQHLTIEVELLAGSTYTLWKRGSLMSGQWEPVPEATITVNGDLIRMEESGVTGRECYYQARN